MPLYDSHFPANWPYTNFHELNLDWILAKVKELDASVAEVLAWKLSWDETLNAITNELSVLEGRVNDLSSQQIAFIQEINQKFNDLAEQNRLEIAALIQSVDNRFNILDLEVTGRLDQQDVLINAEIQSMTGQITGLANELEQAILDLGSTFMVSNPLTGEQTTVQGAINALAALHALDALTAGAYDALALTAGTYDAKNLTAYKYDFQGGNYLP